MGLLRAVLKALWSAKHEKKIEQKVVVTVSLPKNHESPQFKKFYAASLSFDKDKAPGQNIAHQQIALSQLNSSNVDQKATTPSNIYGYGYNSN